MGLLITLILLYLTGVAVFFLKRVYKNLLVPEKNELPESGSSAGDDDIMGAADTPEQEKDDDDEMPLPDGAEPCEADPDTEQNERMAEECEQEMPPSNLPQEEDPDALTVDATNQHFDAVAGTEENFEEKISDTQTVVELARTNIQLENSEYYSKLKEIRGADEKIKRLETIGKELFAEAYNKKMNELISVETAEN